MSSRIPSSWGRDHAIAINRRRSGMTLVEVMVALVILAVVGVAMTKLMRSQMRFADSQATMHEAREVSRTALNTIATDVRMVDSDSGIVLATPDSFDVLAPYAMGIVCGPGASGGSVISLIPYDSSSYAEGGYAGYAYIDTTTTGTRYEQVYQYVPSAITPARTDSATAASTAPCYSLVDPVGVFHFGTVTVEPAIPGQSRYQPAFLYRRVRYSMKPSISVPNRRGLFRRIINGPRGDEEMVAPFAESAGFAYYMLNGTKVTSVTGGNLNSIRGVELRLDGASERLVPGSSSVQKAPTTTAIFFKNRPLQ